MTKYAFILLDKDLNPFLQKLQEWGVMDITRKYKAVDETSRGYIELATRYNNAVRSIRNLTIKEELTPQADYDKNNLLPVAEEFLAKAQALNAQKLELQREETAAQAWGEFNSKDLDRLKELGLNVHFYAVQEKEFDASWEEKYTVQILNCTDGKKYFIVLSEKTDEDFQFPMDEIKIPQHSVNELHDLFEENASAIRNNNAVLLALKNDLDLLKEQKAQHDAILDVYLANQTSEKAAEGQIAVIEGFAPKSDDAELSEKLDGLDVYYLAEEATPEDNPPIKLKNNSFATLFEPIGNLYMLPKYGELDLTPFFAPFYMLFFGLCLGDMGYGLLLFTAGIIGTFKLPKFKNYAKLVTLLGLGSILMPAMTGTFFGVSLYDHVAMPQWFYDVWYNPDTINVKMFWFALIFGVFQICVGRMIAAFYAFKHKGWQYGLANIGWTVFTIWASLAFTEWQGGYTILSPMANNIMLGVSGICIVFFSNITKNIFLRIGSGLKAVYDVTGLLGDILSYVRLFGLGAAGGILGLVMNQIALSLGSVPYVGWLLLIVMLVIGHTLVIFLSCLGAFVHPIRLTFVEFYKNAEFQGGGRKYNPLKR